MSKMDYSEYSFRNYKRDNNNKKIKPSKKKYGKFEYNYKNYDQYQETVEESRQIHQQEQINLKNNAVIIDQPKRYTPQIPEIDNVIIMQPTLPDYNEDLDDIVIEQGSYVIEDMRTKDKKKEKKKTIEVVEDLKVKPKAPKKKDRKKLDIISVLMIVFSIAITIIAVDIYTGGDVFNNVQKVIAGFSNVPTYYAVDLGTYKNKNDAKKASDLFREKGAGGYVINVGDEYHVIATVFDKREDAEKIAEKLVKDGMSGSVYEMTGKNIEYEKYGPAGDNIQSVIKHSEKLYADLYNLSVLLDKKQISEAQAFVKITALVEETESLNDIFLSKTMANSSNEIIVKVRAEISSYSAILKNLNNQDLERPSLIADIRYSYTMILNTSCALQRSL